MCWPFKGLCSPRFLDGDDFLSIAGDAVRPYLCRRGFHDVGDVLGLVEGGFLEIIWRKVQEFELQGLGMGIWQPFTEGAFPLTIEPSTHFRCKRASPCAMGAEPEAGATWSRATPPFYARRCTHVQSQWAPADDRSFQSSQPQRGACSR